MSFFNQKSIKKLNNWVVNLEFRFFLLGQYHFSGMKKFQELKK